MGQSHKSCSSSKNERAYFSRTREEMMKHFSKSQVLMQNSSEWAVIFRENMSKYSKLSWAKPILALLKPRDSFYDSSSRLVFVWDEYQRSHKIKKIDQSRACIWPQSIANLQTFTYEVEINPHKRILNGIVQNKKDCIIYKLIEKFKASFINFYCEKDDMELRIRSRFGEDVKGTLDEVDEIILDFIRIVVKVIPMFFIEFPACQQDIEEIVRNAVVSEEILRLLVTYRKKVPMLANYEYLKVITEFDDIKFNSPVVERLQKDSNQNYLKAIGSLVEIPASQSIGEIHDAVAMLMNYISLGLYDENNSDNILEEDEIIQAFLHIICKSAVHELPVYVDILNKFLDKNTLTVKSVGQGIMKLTYIIDNSAELTSFMSNL